MDPLVERAYRQRQEMERRGVSASAFPKGSNNMSSFFKKEGEGYFESGSSPYSNGSFYESDVASKEKSVWDEDYNKTFAKSLASSTIVETHIASISIHAQAPENVAVEEKKHK